MSSNQTTNYGLHQWQPGDDFLREEFNENFGKLDGASRVVTGSYVGDGSSSRTISLGFTPKAVLVAGTKGKFNDNSWSYGGLAMAGIPATNGGGSIVVQVVTNGFEVFTSTSGSGDYPGPMTNHNSWVFNYIAFY